MIKLKNVMEKSSGVVDLTSPSPSPSVMMTRLKGSATYISAAFMSSWLHSQNALENRSHSLLHSSMVRVGRVPVFWTLSVITNIGTIRV